MSGKQRGGASAPDAFKVWVPVEVRYGDLDDQGRVNNALFFTYFEQGRIGYFNRIRALGRAMVGEGQGDDAAAPAPSGRRVAIAPGATDDRLELPTVVSEASCAYRRPIASLAPIVVGVRTARLGHASLNIAYVVSTAPDGVVYATGSTMLVCVDLATSRPRGLPEWAVAAVRQIEGDGLA